MFDDDQEDRQNWKSSRHSSLPTTLDDATRMLDQAKHGVSQLPSINVQTDEKTGRARLLGFEIPRNVVPLATALVANLVPWVGKHGGEYFYKKGLSIAGTWGPTKGKAELVALAAENIVRWGLIGAQPITSLIYASNLHSQNRRALFEEFSPIMAATKANYKNNEVIKVAFDELHDDVATNIKMIAADIPTMVPQILVGLQDQKEFKAKRKDRLKAADIAGKGTREQLSALNKEIKEQIEIQKRLREQYHGKNQDIIDDVLAEHNKRLRDARNERHHKPEHDQNVREYDKWLVLGGSLVSEVFKNSLEEAAEKRRKRTNSWQMIKRLKQEVEEQCGARSENSYRCDRSFSSRGAEDIAIDGTPLKEYIIEIFQQHERDRAPHIFASQRYGKSDKMKPLGPALVERMMPAIDMIADYVADGRLDPYALVALVGENKVVVHHKNGARTFVKPEEIQKTLDDLLATLSTREAVKPEEFFANFADPALIQETLKKNLSTMQGMEKAFFVSLFPDDILVQAGMKKKDIVAERRKAHGHIYDIVAASILDISQKNPEQLKKLGLSEKDIDSVKELASKIEEGDRKALEQAVDGHDKSTILGAVRTVGLNEQVSNAADGGNYWTRRVGEAGETRTKIDSASKANHDSHDSEEKERHRPERERNDDELFSHSVREKRPDRFASEDGPKPLIERSEREEPWSPRTV